MSERTAENTKLELAMGVLLVIVVAMLAIPFAISLFRATPFVATLLQSVPFVLLTIAIGSMVWATKRDS